MNELFSRIKKLAEKNGEVVIINEKGDDAFVVMSLDRYEVLTENMDFCPEDYTNDDFNCEFPSEDIDFSPENFVFEENKDNDEQKTIDDKDLMKRVNEDIAKWREEQEESKNQENKKVIKQEEKEINIPVNTIGEEDEKENILTDEEKYYLEPLE